MFDFIGKKLGQYEIGEPVGQGGMATVYKAFQPSMNRTVAVKILPPQLAVNPTFLARFRQEAQVIARLEHTHILPVYDYGEGDGVVYIVMRYLDGGSLQKKIDAGHMPLREVSKYLTQIASALEYAHRQGVIHRDIKPSNVLIDRQGDAFLSDFGIAKMMEDTSGLTGTSVIGTPQYMSPEQGQGLPVDARSDVYSLGVVLYEMVTGRLPFDADTPIAVVLQHVSAPLPSPRTYVPDLPPPIEAVLSKALAKSPNDRFATAGELAVVFDDAMRAGLQPETKPMEPGLPPTQQAVSIRPTVVARKRIGMPRLNRSAVMVVTTFIALVSVLVGLLMVSMNNLPPEPPPVGVITAGPNIVTVTPNVAISSPAAPTATAQTVSGDACNEILFDDFSNVSSGFPRGENDAGSWNYADGEYRILIKRVNEFEARTLRQTLADYTVEVDARLAPDAPGSYGLVIGADASGTSYYSFSIDHARNFAVARRTSGGSTLAREWSFAPSLKPGGEVNHLRAVRKADRIALYANDVLMAVVTDTLNVPESASRVGLIAASFGSGSVEARFDNFRVCRAPASITTEVVSLVDAFDDDRNLWGTQRYEGGLSAFIEDGQFQLSVPHRDPRFALFHWNPTFAVGDFELEVESRVLDGPSGSRAGVMFGIQDLGDNYMLYAANDGRLTLYNRVGGSYLALSDGTASSIQTGDAVNRWRIVVANGVLTAWINDQQVLQASIAYTSGAIGFACEPSSPPLARCVFDNLSVRGKPSTGEAVAYPFCNCSRSMFVNQPVRVAFNWPASEAKLVEQFLSAISMTVTIDGKSLADPLQYWSAIASDAEGAETRWRYDLPSLDPGSHIVEVVIITDIEITDGRDANGDGRPDAFGPGELLKGYVQIVVTP